MVVLLHVYILKQLRTFLCQMINETVISALRFNK